MTDSFEIKIKKNGLNNHEKNGVESSKDKSPNLLLQGKINSSSGPNIEGIEQEYEAVQQAFDKATQSHEKEQTNIQNQITSFETEKGSLESSISAKNGIIQNLSSQIQSFGNPTAPNQADYAVVTEEGEGEDKKQVTSYPGYAEALAEYNNKMNQLNQLKAQLQQAQNEKNALDAKVANIDAKISGLNTKSSQSSTEVQMAQTKVNSVKAKLDAAKIQQQQAQMNAINEQNLSLTQNNSENNENITTYENNKKDNKEISKDEISNQLNVLTNFNKNNLNININEIKDKLTKQNALGEIKELKDKVENKILDFQSNSNEITKKLLIGFSANIQQQIKTLENKINIIENEPDKEQVQKEQENTQQEEECLIDPIGIEKDGVTYDFIKYDGDFDSISDFLGSSNAGIGELIALDADKSGAVSGDELANSGIMVVRREGNKQTLVPISEVQKELGGKLSINLAGINAEAKEDQNFDVNIEKADGTTETYNGYSTYKDKQYFKDTYNYEIDNEAAPTPTPTPTPAPSSTPTPTPTPPLSETPEPPENNPNVEATPEPVNEPPRTMTVEPTEVGLLNATNEYINSQRNHEEKNEEEEPEYTTPLEMFAKSGYDIDESLYGTDFTEYLRTNANTNQDVYDYIKSQCGDDEHTAEIIFKYIMEPMYDKDTDVFDTMSDTNPYKGRQETILMNLLYTNNGSKFVLNQKLLDEFTEYTDMVDENGDIVRDEDDNPLQLPTKQYYTNFDGKLCTLEYEYNAGGEEENPYITLKFNEGSSEAKELKYYEIQNGNETIYCIMDENGDIEETEEEFLKRMTILKNYSSDISDANLSTDEIEERYLKLKENDDQTTGVLSTIISEFASEGWIDDVRNWFVETFDTAISNQDIIDEVSATVTYTEILKLWDEGPEGQEKAKKLICMEACRRYQNGDLNAIKDLFKDEKIVSDIVKGKLTIEDALNKTEITKEDAYKYLTNGGEYSPENLQKYQQASEDFTNYNTAIVAGTALQECKTPEEAFKLVTGKDITDPEQAKTVTKKDIELFNSICSFNVPRGDDYLHTFKSDDDITHYYTLSVEYNEKDNKFDINYQEYYEAGGQFYPFPDGVQHEIPDYVDRDGNNLFQESNANSNAKWDEWTNNSLNPNVDRLQRYRFSQYYADNQENVDEYISDFAEYALTDKNLIANYAKKTGIDASKLKKEDIIAYIKSDEDKLYDESCNYMQYAYTDAKQDLFGESQLDAMTSQYCIDMATYSSTISHITSIGCMAASVIFPAASPALMVAAKAAGYLDNAIDLVNMLSNDQGIQDDDYAGWAKNLGFEVLTKAGYRYFSGLAGDWGGKTTEWIIDHTGGEASFFAKNALAQILLRGSSEALIETGICIPYTAALKAIQGGDYNLLDELKENFIYDFLPYARGWQDVLIDGRTPGGTTLYGGDGTYYKIPNSNERLYVDEAGKALALVSVVNGEEVPKVKYDYNEDGSYKVVQYAEDGKTEISSKLIKNNSDGTSVIYDGNDNTKILQQTEKYENGYKITDYDENGKPHQIVITDKKGHILSKTVGSTTTEYGKSGKIDKITTQDDSGNNIEINYSRKFGRTTAKIKIGDNNEYSYRVNKDGTVTYESENGTKITFDDEKALLTNIKSAMEVSSKLNIDFDTAIQFEKQGIKIENNQAGEPAIKINNTTVPLSKVISINDNIIRYRNCSGIEVEYDTATGHIKYPNYEKSSDGTSVIKAKDLDGNDIYYTANASILLEDGSSYPIYRNYEHFMNMKGYTLDEVLSARNITQEEKDVIDGLYERLQQAGDEYIQLVKENPDIFIGMLEATIESDGKIISLYETLTDGELSAIKSAFDQYNGGKIPEEVIKSIYDRMDMSIPYNAFEYIDDYDRIPEDGITNPMSPDLKIPKEKVIEMLESAKTLRAFLNTQSTELPMEITRVDDISIFSNITIDGKTITELLENPTEENINKVLKYFNGGNAEDFKFNNFVGTTLGKMSQFDSPNGNKVVWDIDLPEGSKGLFLNGAIPEEMRAMYGEGEFLLQAGTKFKIEGATYENGRLVIKVTAITPEKVDDETNKPDDDTNKPEDDSEKIPQNNTSNKPGQTQDTNVDNEGPTKEQVDDETVDKIFQSLSDEIEKYEADIDDDALKSMLSKLQTSSKNSSVEDLQAVEKIMSDLIETSEYEYVNFEAIMMGIEAFSDVVKFSDENSYRLQALLSHSEKGGLFSVEDTDSLKNFMDLIKTSCQDIGSKEFYDILFELDKKVGDAEVADENLEKITEEMSEIIEKYGEKASEVLNEYYVNKVPLTDMDNQLVINDNARKVYKILENENISISQDTLMSRYGKAITELIDRGYSIEEISQKLILGNALVVMDSAIHYIPDYKILADFIENGIDLIASDYELLSNYTSDNFDNYNDVTIDEKGNKVYGDKYMADEADALSNLLKQQSIVRDMTVYRGEGFEVLNSYVLDNGQKLGEYLQKIVETGDTEAIKELEAKLVGNTITQPRFMSTSYDQEKASEFIEQETGIMWEIDVNKGAHGLWADPFNTENSDEREILFDRDSKLVIYGIEIVDNIVVIKAKLHQD